MVRCECRINSQRSRSSLKRCGRASRDWPRQPLHGGGRPDRILLAFVPAGDLSRERTISEFNTLQDEQVALTKAAEGRLLNDIRIVLPFDRRIRYNAYSCLVL